MIHDYRYKYKNIIIRQVVEDDLEMLREWRNNPENTRFLRKIPYITKEMQKQWFCSYLSNEDELMFVIEETEDINEVVGSFSMYNFSEDKAEFGKFLVGNNNAHGKSVGLNALIAAMIISKKMLKLKKLYLHVYEKNKAAVKVYKKAGFFIDKKLISGDNEVEYKMIIEL